MTAADGTAVDAPVIVIEARQTLRLGRGPAWGVRARLPAGDYNLYATAKNYSQSDRLPVQIGAGGAEVRDFHDLQLPGHLGSR